VYKLIWLIAGALDEQIWTPGPTEVVDDLLQLGSPGSEACILEEIGEMRRPKLW